MFWKNGERSKSYKMAEPSEFRTSWNSIKCLSLVAFIGSVHTHCIAPGVWPYMKLLIPDVSENFYGLLNSLSSAGIVMAAAIAGWSSNKLKDTKYPMLFGKAMAILSCITYMAIELVGSDLKPAFFLVFELLLGIAVDIYRTHIAMASTEEDRPKAVAICSLAPALGIFIGPLGQIIFTTLGYPGFTFVFDTHINLYTAPVVMTIVISLIGAFLLIFCFDGRMHVQKDGIKTISERAEKNERTEKNEINTGTSHDYDKVAVFICFYTKMLANLCLLNFVTIGVPYAMLAFSWTPEESVLYVSISMLLTGLNICFWNLGYIFFDLRKRLSERRAIVISIFALLVAYVLTYPMPFYQETIPYATGNSTVVGCKHEFKWCATTPRVNMWIFLGSLITVLGLALPLCNINLDILFSKVLGNMKQGTLQGLMIVSGEFISIIGPLALTKVYTLSGPIWIWLFEITAIISGILLWLFNYRRMIGKTRRLTGKQLK